KAVFNAFCTRNRNTPDRAEEDDDGARRYSRARRYSGARMYSEAATTPLKVEGRRKVVALTVRGIKKIILSLSHSEATTFNRV
ncbi:hypothetical protein Tco_0178667, partial [Tanacetum coccineum]